MQAPRPRLEPQPRAASARPLPMLTASSNSPPTSKPDAGLYRLTVADALHTGKPLLLAFSTPAYCQTATCGPQLAVIKELKAKYAGKMNFIHIEVYDNPHEIEGDLSNAVISPTAEEWGLPSEPWTFIVDREGIIRAKFEAFTTREELEAAVEIVVR